VEKVYEKPLTIYEQQRDCTESWIACELKLCVIWTYFHLYVNIEIGVFSWGFPQSILLCSCVIGFSFSVICVLFDLVHSQLSFCKFVVEVDLVFWFSILHNLFIYKGKFYMVSEKRWSNRRIVYKEGRGFKFQVPDYRIWILITSQISPMEFNGLILEYALDGSSNYIA